MNSNFWLLFGSISTTLAALSLLGMTFYYQRAREAAQGIEQRLGAKATIDLRTVLYTSGNNLIYYLLPITLSLIILTSNDKAWYFLLVILSFSFFSCWQIDKARSGREYVFIDYFSSGIFVIIVLLICLLKLNHRLLNLPNYLSWIEILAIISLMMGILLSIQTIIYLEKKDVDFEVPTSTIDSWQRQGRNLQSIADGTFECAMNLSAKDYRSHFGNQLEELMKNIEDFVKNDKLQDSVPYSSPCCMSLSKVKALLNDYEHIKGSLQNYRKSLCTLGIISENSIWPNKSSCEKK